MADFDLKTLIFAATASTVVLGASMVFLWRTNPTETCLKAWAQGGTLLALGFMLLWLRGTVSPFWSIPVGNSAIAAGYCFLLVGAQLYRGMRATYWAVAVSVAAVFLSFLYFTYVTPSVNARIVIISLIIGVAGLWTAYVLFVSPLPGMRFLQRTAAGAMGLHGAFMLVRSVVTLGQLPIEDFFAANTVTAITFVEFLLSSAVFTFMFAILVSRRAILDSRKMALAVAESERRLATLMGNLPGMAYRCRNDRDWTMEFVSDGVDRLTGYRADELVANGKLSYNAIIHPDDRERVWQEAQKAIGKRRPFSAIYRIVTAKGKVRTVWEQGRGVFAENGDLVALEGLVLDVTEQTVAEMALRESEERFAKVFRASPAALSISKIDDGLNVDVNDEWIAMTGYARDEALGKTAGELGAWTDATQRADFVERLRRDGCFRDFAATLRTKNGETRDVVLAGETLEINGEPHMLLAFHDITEQRRAAEQLRHAQKLEVVGQLAGGTAHEFNNILQVVQANLELIGRKLDGDDTVARLIDGALRAGRRGARLTQQLLSFSRRQTLRPRTLDANELIGRTVGLLGRTLGEDIEIETVLDANLPAIHVDASGLESALLNIATNARGAMPQGGKLTIRTAIRRLDDEVATEEAGLPAGDYVEISLADTGCGMPPEVLARAFEPFFTTKDVGEGSGLGLSMVYGFALQSDGHATLESEVGKGTVVRMMFPTTGVKPDGARKAAVKTPIEAGSGTILVVEDDPAVRSSVAMLLEMLGYRTWEAGNGAAALAILDREAGIDLLFTDVVMPGRMSGPELAREALLRHPNLKVLLTSGYSESALEKTGFSADDFALLGKPYSHAQLSQAVKAALAG